MPSIEPRRNKNGEVTSYRITISSGMDSNGRQVRRRFLWTPRDRDMTEKQMEREATAEAYRCEEQVRYGYNLDNNMNFEQYARYVIDLKERNGVKPGTIDRYLEMLPRINEAIGYLKLVNIRPQHLNQFYKDMADKVIRKDCIRATAKRALNAHMRDCNISRQELARKTELSAATMTKVTNGSPVRMSTAEAVAEALGYTVNELFNIHNNSTPLSSKTILEHHRLISTILAQADKELLVPYNSAAKATPPKAKRPRPDYYQPEEMEEIIEALDNAPLLWRTITYLLIDTGCRRGEIMGLKWKNVNFDTNVITIDCALLYSQKLGIYEGDTKTGDFRAIKIAEQTMDMLRRWKEEYEDLKEDNEDRWVNTPYVFVHEDGSPLHPDSITSWLGRFSQKYNLPHIHPHAFRHTAASMMIANGVDLVTTAAELGHANATTTAMIYAHQIAVARATAADVRGGVFDRRKKKEK